MKRFVLIASLVVVIGLLAACAQSNPPAPQPATTQVACPECAACPEAATCPEPQACPEAAACPEVVVANIPFADQWANSPHNDKTSEAFVHWDSENPAVVPANCAKCHSETGYLDFLGADGTEAGVINAENFPVGTTVTCVACHNQATMIKDSVTFPSGETISHLGDEARCMECHQGRESTMSVTKAITSSGVTDDDAVSDKLGFKNIHYFAAAATQYGTLAKGGFEYEGKSYDTKFFHVEGYDTCNSCHDSHTLELKISECQTCHTDVKSVEDLATIRMAGSESDYDGDGDVTEGIQAEAAGVQEVLYATMQKYAAEKLEAPIAYNATAYPYFFNDANKDGSVGDDEAKGDNGYKSWTARLLKAAYNYQVASKDPGQFAHNGKYIIQLMYDSIADLGTVISTTVPLDQLTRNDPGHFAGSEEAFRHWDEEGKVPGGCVKCHQAEGLPEFVAEGTNVSKDPSNGFTCTTCHSNLQDFARIEIKDVKFPSGATVSMTDPDSNLCISCHQGRASASTIDGAVKGLEEDTVPEKGLRFTNIHYFAAGATMFGDEVKGAYEYPDLAYVGKFAHVEGFDNCTSCHATHELEVKADKCATCHAGVEALTDIRGPLSTADYDGDGNVDEGIAGEIQTYNDKVYAAMQDYAANVVGKAILYNGNAYPYFFEDTDGNGEINGEEGAYSAWTPRLLKAAYNYQYVQKDPGAFAHNGKYVLQFLYDTLSSLGQKATVDMTGLVRPEAPAAQ